MSKPSRNAQRSQQQLFLPGFDLNGLFDDDETAAGQPAVSDTLASADSFSGLVRGLKDAVEVVPMGARTKAIPDVPVHVEAPAPDVQEGEEEPEDVPAFVPVAATRGPVASEAIQLATSVNWPRLTEASNPPVTGAVARYQANVAAIKLLNALDVEQRALLDEERAVLLAYSGWGGLKDAFDHKYEHQAWHQRFLELKEMLSEAEYSAARDSVLSAHYTPQGVVNAIWDRVVALGFTGGRVLDPSAGVGAFVGGMPTNVARQSAITGVEIDSLSARIFRALYGPAVKTLNSGFEAVDIPDGWFDLAITNVPFGEYRVADGRRRPYSRWTIHNWFIGRCLDAVRPGGLVVVITSSHVMDARETAKRDWLGSQAELLGAVRLPVGAFSATANTDVGADVLFLRKRQPGEPRREAENAWNTRLAVPTSMVTGNASNSDRMRNRFWTEVPDAVIGKWTPVSGQYCTELKPMLENAATETAKLLPAALQAVLASASYLPAQVLRSSKEVVQEEASEDEDSDAKIGSIQVFGGMLYQRTWQGQVRLDLAGKREQRVLGLVALRDCLREVLAAQLNESSADAELSDLRGELNRIYDQHVKRNGFLHERGNSLAFRSDPDWPLLLSLEHWHEDEERATKAAIFTTRTASPSRAPVTADSSEDAVAICMAECGQLRAPYLAQLLGRSEGNVLQELEAEGAVFLDPDTSLYVSRDEYLSGNVVEKLKKAQLAGPRFHRSVQQLQAVQPEPLTPADIDVRLGAGWVPSSVYSDFTQHVCGDAWDSFSRSNWEYEPLAGSWGGRVSLPEVMTRKIGTLRVEALKLFLDTMNGREITIKDEVVVDGSSSFVLNVVETAAAREKQEQLQNLFADWLWKDSQRSKLVSDLYNERYHSVVERKFDGSRLRLPGYSQYLSLSPHQLNAVARIVTGENLLLAHCVGAGKSLVMICGLMELRRLGLRKKPILAVPNHMLDQISGDFMRAYPTAKLLVATLEDFGGDRRREFVGRIATGDWDCVVMTHSTLERIKPDQAIMETIADEAVAEIEAAMEGANTSEASDKTTLRQLLKLKKDYLARLETSKAMWKKDDLISLSMLGVDFLAVDEAHAFKNAGVLTMKERVSGLATATSQRAFDMLAKTRELMAVHGGAQRGVLFATATPVANSVVELYVMQRYLQPKTLEQMGLAAFDSWAAQFGRTVTALEIAPDGSSFRMNTRFSSFVNTPELLKLLTMNADIQTKQMLNLPTPPKRGGEVEVISAKQNEIVKAYVDELVQRAEAIKDKRVKPSEDNMLAVTTDGRKAALDMRLVAPAAEFDPNGKVALCLARVHALWQESAPFRGTQMIFCDQGIPGGKGFNLYEDMRYRLVEMGVPRSEIAFIHEASTHAAKAELFKKVRAGVIRVLIGSTSKMGTGTNAQTLLFALHHLDAPWRPADVEQRDGRIERRGNTCPFINILRYVTEGSFDSYIWQALSTKARFIGQVMSGDRSLRRIEDADEVALSYEEVKAIACGNPAVRKKALLEAEYRKLGLLQTSHQRAVRQAKFELATLPAKIVTCEKELAAYTEDEDVRLGAGDQIQLDGWSGSTSTDDAAEALGEALKEFMAGSHSTRVQLGTVWGLTLIAEKLVINGEDATTTTAAIYMFGNKVVQRIQPTQSGARMLGRLAGAVEDRLAVKASVQRRLTGYRLAEPTLVQSIEQVFEHSDRMRELRVELEALDVELGLTKSGIEDAPAADVQQPLEQELPMAA